MSLPPRREEEQDGESEITLSTGSLLALFLGLVLVCGVFFGFGYSVGRRTPASTALNPGAAGGSGGDGHAGAIESDSSAPASAPAPSPAPSSESSSTLSGLSSARGDVTPLPVLNENPAHSPSDRSSAGPDSAGLDSAGSGVANSGTAAAAQAALKQQSGAQPALASLSRSKASAIPQGAGHPIQPEPGHPMVQVAAVVHREDADVLVSALRSRGYNAVVRTEPQDKFLHVQVGPFASRVQADAMRQKLYSDGYNAIIKQ